MLVLFIIALIVCFALDRLDSIYTQLVLSRVHLPGEIRQTAFHIEVRGQRKTSVFSKSSSYSIYFIIHLPKKYKVDYNNKKKARF